MPFVCCRRNLRHTFSPHIFRGVLNATYLNASCTCCLMRWLGIAGMLFTSLGSCMCSLLQWSTELPVAGSSFTYVMASLGQLPAFLVTSNMVSPQWDPINAPCGHAVTGARLMNRAV